MSDSDRNGDNAAVIECSICLDFYSTRVGDRFVTTKPCGHIFHDFCLQPVFDPVTGGSQCPNCRTSIWRDHLVILSGVQPIRGGTVGKRFRITVIGDLGVGKSCLSRRFCEEAFPTNQEPTVGLDFWTKNVRVGDKSVNLSIWDTSGQERFKAVSPQYLRQSQGVVVVYDSVHGDSLQHAIEWFHLANLYAPNAIKVLVGTKMDLEECDVGPGCPMRPCYSPTEAEKQKIADMLGVYCFETSAVTDLNVEIVFKSLVGQILEGRLANEQQSNLIQLELEAPAVEKKRCGC